MKKIIAIILALILLAAASFVAFSKDKQIAAETVELDERIIYNANVADVLERTGINFYYLYERAQNVIFNVITPEEEPMAEAVFIYNDTEMCYRAKPVSATALSDVEDFSGMYYTVDKTTDTNVGYCSARVLSMQNYTIVQWLDAVPGVAYSLCINEKTEPETAAKTAEQLFKPLQGEADGAAEVKQTDPEALIDAIENAVPGVAGSSLKRTIAAGMLMDFAQENTLTEDSLMTSIEDCLNAKANEKDNFKANFIEAYPGVKDMVMDMTEDLKPFESMLESCGYEMQHTQYDKTAIDSVCRVIEKAIER